MLSILRKYIPLQIKHFFNTIYVNSFSGFILSNIYGNIITIDNINILVDKKIINYLYYARIILKKYERIEIDQINKYLIDNLDTIELGCGIGVTSAHILKKLNNDSRLFCFEANPELLNILEKNLSINTKFKNFYIENKLINYNDKKIFFNKEKNYLLSKVKNSNSKKNLTEVESIQLNQIINKYKINYYNLVCDIEGSEIFFLVNDKEVLKNCKLLIIELHPIKYNNYLYQINEIENIIINLGFKKIDDQHACKVFINQ